MDHASAYGCYFDDLVDESVLSTKEWRGVRIAIQNIVLQSSVAEEIVELEATEIEAITLKSPPEKHRLIFEVTLSKDVFETEPLAFETQHADGDVSIVDDPHYLRDMGPCWGGFEYEILRVLVRMLDLPETAAELAYYLYGVVTAPRLIGLNATDTVIRFGVTVKIPDHTRQIYQNRDFELAEQLQIPLVQDEFPAPK